MTTMLTPVTNFRTSLTSGRRYHTLPADLESQYTVVLFYRGHW